MSTKELAMVAARGVVECQTVLDHAQEFPNRDVLVQMVTDDQTRFLVSWSSLVGVRDGVRYVNEDGDLYWGQHRDSLVALVSEWYWLKCGQSYLLDAAAQAKAPF